MLLVAVERVARRRDRQSITGVKGGAADMSEERSFHCMLIGPRATVARTA